MELVFTVTPVLLATMQFQDVQLAHKMELHVTHVGWEIIRVVIRVLHVERLLLIVRNVMMGLLVLSVGLGSLGLHVVLVRVP